MGRAKRKLELLNNQKERCRTFERRMKGLKKKAQELKTLCNVEVGLIVDNEPKAENGDHRIDGPQIWPSDPNLIKNLIISHRNQPADSPSSSSDLFTFFKIQNDKIRKEIMILKGENEEDMYPAWDDSYNVLSREKIEEFGGLIAEKIQFLKTRIEAMRWRSSFYYGPEQSSFHNQSEAQNKFYFPSLISSKQHESGNSFNSSNQISIACGSSGGVSSVLVSRPSNGFHEPEPPPRDSNYFQKQITVQNNLYCSGPISYIYPEAEKSGISFENKFYAQNQVAELSTDNDVCYNQLEDLFSNEYLNGFMDGPISENSDHSIANIEGCFDMGTQFVSHFSEDLEVENLTLGLERSFSTEWDDSYLLSIEF